MLFRKVFKQNKVLSLIFAVFIFGLILYYSVGHMLIKAMYEGRSISFLNDIIDGRTVHPLRFYFLLADRLFLMGSFSILLLIGCICAYFRIAKVNLFEAKIKLKSFLINVSLLCFTIILMLVFLEIVLRFTSHRYKYAAEAQLRINQSRIFENPKNARLYQKHPDSNNDHLIIYNSMGFRQHREFLRGKPKDVVRIGFFGDSYTANLRMQSQYSFTEPLNYLLNKTGGKYEVMNFGTDGYGTDQIYLQYLQDGVHLNLDLIFYVYCCNDLRNIRENNLFSFSSDRVLNIKQYNGNWFTNLINKFYLTYFILDHNERLQKKIRVSQEKILQKQKKAWFHHPRYEAIERDFARGSITADVRETLELFLAILTEMENLSHKHNTEFYVVTLPMTSENTMSDFLNEHGFTVLNLHSKFKNVYPEEKSYLFEYDDHWNEEGNKLAAIFLFKFLAEELAIGYSGDAFIEQSLYEYYSSFESKNVSNYALIKHNDFSPVLNDNIKSMYLFLEEKNGCNGMQ